ncbi:hypothetical protein ACVNIS_17165 [Sphaerotilaceae bacterium SBD11-9]
MLRTAAIALLSSLAFLSACGGSEEDDNPTEAYAGTYTATLSGSQSGTMTVIVTPLADSDSSTISGTLTTTQLGTNRPIRGALYKNGSALIQADGVNGGMIQLTPQFGSSGFSGDYWVTTGGSGTVTGTRGSSSGGGGGDSNLVGTWINGPSNAPYAREVLSSDGTGNARTWSTTSPRLDGYYIEYTWSASGGTKTTTVTKYIACDFNAGTWVSQSNRPSGSVSYTLSNGGSTVTYSNAPSTPYTKSTGSNTAPTAGSACTKL